MREMENWMQMIIAVLSGLVTAIPLVYKLVEYIRKAVKEKNWPSMLEKGMTRMATSEKKFESGADRKEWVIAMMKASADSWNYDLDVEALSKMIDSLCDMSNVVNAPAEQ